MKQLVQKLKNGQMEVLDFPIPLMQKGSLLVKVHYSLISAGTEGSTVKTARKGLVGKAKERPQQAKQVFDTLKSQGAVQTYRAVMKKLDAYSPLGYSCVGEVIDVASDVRGFAVGDKVACAGLSASHAEVVSVPINLCVKLPSRVDMKQSAYNTLGAIAMQGVRQADLRLGETCAVIGLGLIGQLTALLLQASGVRTIGIDIDQSMVDMAEKHCLDLACQRNSEGIADQIHYYTGGVGCDVVIITAASASLDPINFAGTIARKKGKVVVVGAVPTGFDREPHYYKKELSLKMSCSYGPGRYDPIYEEKGIDYPIAYVRWTEKRNMEAFQHLIASGKIDVSYLTTHIFKLEDAPSAYDLMMEKSEPFVGILVEYDFLKEVQYKKIAIESSKRPRNEIILGIGFIGAGSYAQSNLLPNIPKNGKISLEGVMTNSGTSARSVAERYGFDFCTDSEKDIINSNSINTVFVATRHDSHAELVGKALQEGKHVFVEKPLCLTIDELINIIGILKESEAQLMVGYNRRFSPFAEKIKKMFNSGPMAMTYRVNAGKISSDSWIQDLETGGGRIVGEVCHFVDFLTYINESLPVSVYAIAVPDPESLNDTLNISLKYQNGSIGSIAYYSNGDKSLPKERFEVFANGCTAILDDFRHLTLYSKGKKKKINKISQDKGQKNEVQSFLGSLLQLGKTCITIEELYTTSLTTFKIVESLKSGEALSIDRL